MSQAASVIDELETVLAAGSTIGGAPKSSGG
jgi:hypothetical protein